MNERILKAAREIMVDECPMNWDCGRKCGAACCKPDDDGQGGMYLFPGEEKLTGSDWAQVLPAKMGDADADIFICDGTCVREKRPLGCMIFPLTPVVDEAGRVDVRFDCRARRMCPLLGYGLEGLRSDFVQAVRAALRLIASDEEGLKFLRDWQALEEQFDFRL